MYRKNFLKVRAYKNMMFYDARQHEYKLFGSNNYY